MMDRDYSPIIEVAKNQALIAMTWAACKQLKQHEDSLFAESVYTNAAKYMGGED